MLEKILLRWHIAILQVVTGLYIPEFKVSNKMSASYLESEEWAQVIG